MTKVYLWDANDRLEESQERDRDFVTEIFNRDHTPSIGALLIGIVRSGGKERGIRAVGRVKSISRVSQGRRRVRIEPLLIVDEIEVETLMAQLETKVARRVERAGWPTELRPTQLPPTAADGMIAVLARHGGIGAWLSSWEAVPQAEPAKLQEVQESRDAIGLALEIADIPGLDKAVFSRPTDAVVPDDVIASVLKGAHLADNEEDLIPEELRRFEKDTSTQLVAGHVGQLRGRDYELLVFNVNKKPLEIALGVDLVYWDTVKNIFTLVQYKRLDPEDGDGVKEWTYKNEGEIRRQLDLMVIPATSSTASADWRMTSPYWFKFVRRDATRLGSKTPGFSRESMFPPITSAWHSTMIPFAPDR